MKLQFVGAARRVTGSCYYIETSTLKLLVDCGMIQGSNVAENENYEEFPFNPREIDYVLVTHAHLDHVGRIPKLVKDGFTGQIIATGATSRLAYLIMEDSTRILAHEAARENKDPIYTEDDVLAAKALMQEAEYRKPIQLDDKTTVEFFDAGHILGSAQIKITHEDKSIVFSGDLGNPPVPILKATEHVGHSNYIVMESTYGARNHEDKEERVSIMRQAIMDTINAGGVLMVPAFAMERTQELLYEINNLVNNKQIPQVPIFLDSPLAIKATNIFKDFKHMFDKESHELMKDDKDLFDFPGLRMTLTTEESKAINDYPNPKVIIAGSGMAQGGRILHHIERYISDPNSTYLIVGFQVYGSLGRRLLDGDPTIKVHGQELEVKAKVQAIGGYSAHADQDKLTEWVNEYDAAGLKTIFLTHGEEGQALMLQDHLRRHTKVKDVQVPEPLQIVEL